MQERKLYSAIGVMSGTSMDGIDIAFLQSDGKSIIQNKKFSYSSFDKILHKEISSIIKSRPEKEKIESVGQDFTFYIVDLVKDFMRENNLKASEIDLIAFPGHTILHDPDNHITEQIGSPETMEEILKIRTFGHFRKIDVARGGQGAPLVPIYHFCMTKNLPKPLAILNIGGVNNITYIPSDDENEMTAFDICFGNAPFDDLMMKSSSKKYDKDGQLALSGAVNQEICDQILQNDIFYKEPPKSFDRDDFHRVIEPVNSLKIQDSLASLAYIHAKALAKNIDLYCSKTPKAIYICGGGLKNKSLMKYMKEAMPKANIESTAEIGFDPDQIEAQAFAFLGIRRSLGLPISFQKTTGILPETDSFPASSQR